MMYILPEYDDNCKMCAHAYTFCNLFPLSKTGRIFLIHFLIYTPHHIMLVLIISLACKYMFIWMEKIDTLVSRSTPHIIWVLYMAVLRLSSVPVWYSYVPWEKLKRATFIPALRSFSSTGTSRDFGPNVQMIFVLEIPVLVSPPPLPNIP